MYFDLKNIFVYVGFGSILFLIGLLFYHQSGSSQAFEAVKRVEQMESRQLEIMEEMRKNKLLILENQTIIKTNQETIKENQEIANGILTGLKKLIELHEGGQP